MINIAKLSPYTIDPAVAELAVTDLLTFDDFADTSFNMTLDDLEAVQLLKDHSYRGMIVASDKKTVFKSALAASYSYGKGKKVILAHPNEYAAWKMFLGHHFPDESVCFVGNSRYLKSNEIQEIVVDQVDESADWVITSTHRAIELDLYKTYDAEMTIISEFSDNIISARKTYFLAFNQIKRPICLLVDSENDVYETKISTSGGTKITNLYHTFIYPVLDVDDSLSLQNIRTDNFKNYFMGNPVEKDVVSLLAGHGISGYHLRKRFNIKSTKVASHGKPSLESILANSRAAWKSSSSYDGTTLSAKICRQALDDVPYVSYFDNPVYQKIRKRSVENVVNSKKNSKTLLISDISDWPYGTVASPRKTNVTVATMDEFSANPSMMSEYQNIVIGDVIRSKKLMTTVMDEFRHRCRIPEIVMLSDDQIELNIWSGYFR